MSNRFPQLEWINVDGRQVPVPKVQHYKKGSTTETELTGHDNPFPVANYTQNSNGLWLPVSEDNPVPTQLTGSNVEVNQIKANLPEETIEPGHYYTLPVIDWTEEKFSKVRFGFYALGGRLSCVWESSLQESFNSDTYKTQRFSDIIDERSSGTRLTTVDLTPGGRYSRLMIGNNHETEVMRLFAIAQIMIL